MGAPQKFDEETRARAVRLYLEEAAGVGVSKAAARRRVGELLGVNPATLRNWIERERAKEEVPDVPVDLVEQVERLQRIVAAYNAGLPAGQPLDVEVLYGEDGLYR
jgi:transposase-like protein